VVIKTQVSEHTVFVYCSGNNVNALSSIFISKSSIFLVKTIINPNKIIGELNIL